MNDFLKTLFPTIASALLGPLGGMAVAAVSKIVGVEASDVKELGKAFDAGRITPDHLAALKELELKYKNDEAERGFKYADLEFNDRDSARQMQVGTKSAMPAILTIMITVGFFGILGWMLNDDKIADSPPLLIMLGSLGTAWTTACAFWFGTTSGSADKNRLLAGK